MTPGLLSVGLVRDRGGRTRVGALTQRFPQRVTTPMYLDREAPTSAYLCVQNPTGGLFPGDHLETRIDAGAATGLTVRGQSATQVYAGDEPARHDWDFRLGADAVVEHVPDVTIPHAGCDYRQRTAVRIASGAVFIGWDGLAAGRVGHGERFGYRGVELRTEIECEGTLRAVDVQRLRPGERDPRRRGALGGFDYTATMTILAPGRDDALGRLATCLRGQLADAPTVAAVSALPDDIGLTVRALAARAPPLRRLLHTAWSAARVHLLGRHRTPERIAR